VPVPLLAGNGATCATLVRLVAAVLLNRNAAELLAPATDAFTLYVPADAITFAIAVSDAVPSAPVATVELAGESPAPLTGPANVTITSAFALP
jgi:hypothetical protein